MKIKRTAILALTILMIIGSVSVYAAGYQLKVYSGNGSFDGTDTFEGTSVTVDAENATVSVDGGDAVEITMPDGKSADESKYFVRGLKLTGHDNDEVLAGPVDLTDTASPVKDQDASLVVAYGLKGGMVEYTVNYVDADTGEDLLDPDTHYGVKGDKPVLSYKYVDGYLPNAWNETATIAEDGSTEFTFYYTEIDDEDKVITIKHKEKSGASASGSSTGANGSSSADGSAASEQEPADIVDLDEENGASGTSGSDAEDADSAEADSEGAEAGSGGGISPVGIGAGVLAVAAVGAAAYAIIRRRSEYEYVDDDEE